MPSIACNLTHMTGDGKTDVDDRDNPDQPSIHKYSKRG